MNVGLFPSFFIYKYSKICRNLQIISVLNNVKNGVFAGLSFLFQGSPGGAVLRLARRRLPLRKKGLSDLSGKGFETGPLCGRSFCPLLRKRGGRREPGCSAPANHQARKKAVAYHYETALRMFSYLYVIRPVFSIYKYTKNLHNYQIINTLIKRKDVKKW